MHKEARGGKSADSVARLAIRDGGISYNLGETERTFSLNRPRDSKHQDYIKAIVLYRSSLAELPMIFLLILFSIGAVVLTIKYPSSILYIGLFEVASNKFQVPLPLFAFFPLIILSFFIHRLYNSVYKIGIHSVSSVEGLLSMMRKDTRIDYVNVRGIEINSSIFQRVFDLGDVEISSATNTDFKLVFRGIRAPYNCREIIESRIRSYAQSLQADTRFEILNAKKTSAFAL